MTSNDPFDNINDQEWSYDQQGLGLDLNGFDPVPEFDFGYTDPTQFQYTDPAEQQNSNPYPLTFNPSTSQNTLGFDHVGTLDVTSGLPETRSSTALRPPAGPSSTIVPLDADADDDNRRRSSSSNSDAVADLDVASRKFTREKPKYDPKHPWHRINTTTQGLTKRSGKINQYSAEEMYKQNIANPFGSWTSPAYQFDYSKHGELTKLEYSIDEVKDFIYHHPMSETSKLRIWIQKTPADSCRRYPSATLSKCRFKKCPMRRANLNGTIPTGHMRVALDERSATYEDKADPFYMAANFHLYCFEQFLDLPEICTLKNVEVLADTRQLMNEPNMKWNASLSNVKEGVVAKLFIDACHKGRATIKGFPNYPRPQPGVRPGSVIKPHEFLLNYHMQQAKEGNRPQSAAKALAKRPQRETQLNVNFGDLEMLVAAKVAQRRPQPVKPKRRKVGGEWYPAFSDDEDSDNGNGGDGSVSDPDSPAERPKRKKRRTDDGPSGGVVPVEADPEANAHPRSDWPAPQQQSSYNTADASLLGYGGAQYAWPQYAAGETSFDQQLPDGVASAPADAVDGDPSHLTTTETADAGIADGTEISASASTFLIDPNLDFLNDFSGAPAVAEEPVPDYPPISDAPVFREVSPLPPLPHMTSPPPPSAFPLSLSRPSIHSTTVTPPTGYVLDPNFTLAQPTKRSSPSNDDDDEDDNDYVRLIKRQRSSAASDKISPKNMRRLSRKASIAAGKKAAVSPPPVQTPKTPRRRSSRLFSKSTRGGSGGSRFGSSGTGGGDGDDSGRAASLGSLFDYDY
ncbi:hypothetical protein UCDDS831_g00998 [Diplodia seriata]|uniref:Uncharacterized protein n=1 Tax=Diplodia seriata TaxID=420778 RepID=A0A0G2HEQ5_9PEZI|nr:hypothetical protein UCDDS831_g00998 [Diplodia seriata]